MVPNIQVAATYLFVLVAVLIVFNVLWKSFWTIGPTEVGLVRKRFGRKKLQEGQPVALNGEAGYQADLLPPGLRIKLWPLYVVERHPLVQIPAGQIGVVIAQVGAPLPTGAKFATYSPAFGNFQDVRKFMTGGGQRGVQRPVLSPETNHAPVDQLVLCATYRKRLMRAGRWGIRLGSRRGPGPGETTKVTPAKHQTTGPSCPRSRLYLSIGAE